MSWQWRRNLQGFGYLFDPDRSHEVKVQLISEWIAKNPPGKGDGWEASVLSGRIVNWIKFFLRHDKVVRESWSHSLYTQAAWLEQNIERHLLANHYLKNAVALLFAGMYFEGGAADRWLKQGWQMLLEESKEQFLVDGGHYERSPMYHSICACDYLDVLNLIQSSRPAFEREEIAQLRQTVASSLNFLHDMVFPDQDIPLFNDAAFGMAPSPLQLFNYAQRVMGYHTPVVPTGLTLHERSGSGYYVCRNGEDMMVIDCGAIGPDYQPGHAHCDTLSFELVIDGRRVIVDSGVFDYQLSEERAYARSTRAHNTVVVDGKEQSEMWEVFCVARRAKPLSATLTKQSDGTVLFEGAHNGYTTLKGKPIHKRRITYDGQGSWVVKDLLEGSGMHRMESYLHVHPDFHIIRMGACIAIKASSGHTIAMVDVLGTADTRLEQGWYFPEFGVKHENHVIVFFCSQAAPFDLSYRIRKMAGQS
ncbi:MAG: alginate lyase family protein [Nitrospira sp.]|nr:alginate lyase family protein [Nitrospira sp.]